MATIDPQSLWFHTPDTFSLCRGGSNGPDHPSQLYAIKKYLKPVPMSFLDYGCGSGTTPEAIIKEYGKMPFFYLGVDIIPKNVDWCVEKFPSCMFSVNKSLHKINQLDQSFDVVHSRHVVDHMESFEEAMDEHCRVARKLVIVTLWVPMSDTDEHDVKNIVDQGKVYENEYTNSYSRKKVMEYLDKKQRQGWKLLELTENVGSDVGGFDWVIVLERGGEER